MSLSPRAVLNVRSYVLSRLDDQTKRLVTAATFDIHFGPFEAGMEPDGDGWIYPGFADACDKIREAISVSDLYVDEDDYVTETEPEAAEECSLCAGDLEGENGDPCEECGGTSVGISIFTTVDGSYVKRIAFGALSEYI